MVEEHLARLGGQFARQLRDEVVDFKIEFQPETTYALSYDLCKVLSSVEQSDAKTTFDDLRDLNNQFAGESSVDVLAKLELSGELLAISELVWDWVQQYARRRLEKFNGKDAGFLTAKFERLRDEFANVVLSQYFNKPTVGCFLMWPLMNRYSWLLWVELLDSYIGLRGKHRKGDIPRPEIAAAIRADTRSLDGPKFNELWQDVCDYFKWQKDFLPDFFDRIGKALTSRAPAELDGPLSKQAAIEQLKILARDMTSMRCFLCGSKPGNISVAVGGTIVGLKWITLNGMIELHVGDTQGLRILIGLELCEKCFEVVVVPAGLLAFAAQAA